MFSFGDELKRERESRGIRLAQIAETTNVGVRFLGAIESGRVDIIPGRFYQRAYVRAYARYLGLDEERILTAYEFAAAGGRVPGTITGGADCTESSARVSRQVGGIGYRRSRLERRRGGGLASSACARCRESDIQPIEGVPIRGPDKPNE